MASVSRFTMMLASAAAGAYLAVFATSGCSSAQNPLQSKPDATAPDSTTPDSTTGDSTVPDSTSEAGSKVGAIAGIVLDISGHPVAGVLVSTGSANTMTATDGSYKLSALLPTSARVVSYSKDGYLPFSKALPVVPGGTTEKTVFIVPMVTPLSLNATTGGTVSGLRGATLTAPAGAFVNPSSGKAITGMVDVYLRPLDPAVSQEAAAYPGSLVGVSMGGTTGLIQSAGLLEVTVEQAGKALQVATGKSLQIKVPATVGGGAPSSSDLWVFDQKTAVWSAEGTATLAGGFYSATLYHLCWHNVGPQGLLAACFTGTVTYPDGGPVPEPEVTSSATPPAALAVGEYFSQPVGAAGSGGYCVWGEPGTQTTLVATDLQGGTGTLITKNVLKNFPTAFPGKVGPGAGGVGECATLGPAGFVAVAGCQPANIVLGSTLESEAGAPSCAAPPPTDAGTDGASDGGDAGLVGDAGDAGAASCLKPLQTFSTCFNASGGCMLTLNMSGEGGAGIVDVSYGSGAKMTIDQEGAGTAALTYMGPGGKACGSAVLNSSGLDVTIPDAGTFQLAESTDMQGVIVCPDGTLVVPSSDQLSAIQNCSSLFGGGVAQCSAGGTDGGAPVTCDEPSQHACVSFASGAAASALKSACAPGGGMLVSSCPTTNELGCCRTALLGENECFYSGGTITAAQAKMACATSGGTWTP